MSPPNFEWVRFKIAQIFPQEREQEILNFLSAYQPTDSYHTPRSEASRVSVYLACLLLCGGDPQALKRYAEVADLDERDVWGPAGYPTYLAPVASEYEAWKRSGEVTVPRLSNSERVVTLDADVAEVFTSSADVNKALRSIIGAMPGRNR